MRASPCGAGSHGGLVDLSGTTCRQKRHGQSVGCGAKWPGIASNIMRIEFERAVGVGGSTGE